MPPPAPPLRWDLVDEHLDEAGFFWRQRTQGLLDPERPFARAARDTEPRLLAHLDGLLVAGPRVVRRLAPALAHELPGVVAAAAWALLARGEPAGTGAVLEAFAAADGPQLVGLREALELAPAGTDVAALLAPRLPSLDAAHQAAALRVLAFRRHDAGALVRALPLQRDAELAMAALRCVPHLERGLALQLVGWGLQHPLPQAREWARAGGLALGLREMLRSCRAAVEAGEPHARVSLLALALNATPQDLALLDGALADPTRRAEALWALSFHGRPALVDRALAALEALPDAAAYGALCAMLGLPPERFALPGAEPLEDDAPQDASGAASEAALPAPAWGTLPAPDVPMLRDWWAEARTHLAPDVRLLAGAPLTPTHAVGALERAVPARRRPALALELAARSRGAVRLEPLDWAARQHEPLAAVPRTLAEAALQRPLEAALSA